MASELQQQVQRHREKYLVSAPVHKGRPSLFLSPKDAAAVDIADIYETAVKGLRVLCQYEHRFQAYFRTLFKQSSTEIQRELKTASENEALDRELAEFLGLLALYASEHSAHAVLEYLIRRYRINELNAEPLIRSVIPLHDTKIFAKVIEITKLEGSMWSILEGVKKSGSPLPRAVLITHARKHVSVLAALTAVATSAVTVGSSGQASNHLLAAGVNQIVSFYTAAIVELCDNRALDDAQLRVLYPYIVGGLTKEVELVADTSKQWSQSSCIILSQISRTTRFAVPFINGIVSAMFSKIAGEISRTETHADSVLKAFVIFTQLQSIILDAKLIDILLSGGLSLFLSIIDALIAMSDRFDVESAFDVLFNGFVECLISSEKSKGDAEKSMLYQGAVNHFLCSGVLSQRQVSAGIDKVITFSLDLISDSKLKKTHKLTYVGPVVEILLQRYSELFNAAIKLLRSANSSLEEADATQKKLWCLLRDGAALGNTLYGMSAAENGTGLLLSLSHPSSEVRSAAVDTFDEVVSVEMVNDSPHSADLIGLAGAVLRCLCGTDEDVCSRGWKANVVGKIIKIASPGDVTECITTAFAYWSEVAIRKPKKDGRNVLNCIMECLRNTDVISMHGDCIVSLENRSEVYTLGTWLSSKLLSIANLEADRMMESHPAMNDADESRVKKLLKIHTAVQSDALSTILSLGDHNALFSINQTKSKNISFADFICHIADHVGELVQDRDERLDGVIRILAAIAKLTLRDFFVANAENTVNVNRQYYSLVALLQGVCNNIAGRESDSSQVPSIRSCFLAVHELFSSVLAVIIPFEMSLAFNSKSSQFLMKIYRDYVSNDFSAVLRTDFLSVASNERSMISIGPKFLNNDDPDSILLMYFLSTSTKHADIASLLGPLLMSGLVGKTHLSAINLFNLLVEVIVADTCSNKDILYQSSRVISGYESVSFRYFDPLATSPELPSVCKDIFTMKGGQRRALITSAEAKIAACQAVCSILQMINPCDKVGAGQMASALAIICPLVVHLLSAEQPEIRRAGLILCRQLMAMFKALKSSLKFVVPFSQSISFVNSIEFDSESVSLFCGLFLSGEELIVQDPARTTQLLSDNLFRDNNAMLGSLKKLLLSVTATFGWAYPSITSSLLRSLLMSCDESTLLENAWPFIKSLFLCNPSDRMLNDDSAPTADALFLSEIILRCLTYTVGASKAAVKLESDVLTSIVQIINAPSDAMYAPVVQWLSLSGHNSGSDWSSKINDEHRVVLFQTLLNKSLRYPGSPNVVAALALIPVDMQIIVDELLTYKKAVEEAVKSDDFGDLDDKSDRVTYSNVCTAPNDAFSSLKTFYNALDSVLPLIKELLKNLRAENAYSFGATVCLMYDLLGVIVNPKFSSVLVIEYCKGIILDTIQYIIQAFAALGSALTNTSSAKTPSKTPSKRSRQRSGSTNSVTSMDGDALFGGAYAQSRFNVDTDCLFKVLQTSRLHQTQSSVLAVLNSMMQLSPSIVSSHAIRTLGDILSSTTISTAAETGNALSVSTDSTASLLRNVLTTLTKFVEAGGVKSSLSDSASSWDFVVQPLFAHFQTVSVLRRAALVKTAVDVLGEGCISACVSALLSHSYVSFCIEETTCSMKKIDEMDADEAEEPQIFTAVISRAADKKAGRQVIVSPPQEIFQLAVNTFLACSNPVVQTSTLVLVMNTAAELFEYGLRSCRKQSTDDNVCMSYVSSILEDCREFTKVSDSIKLAVLHLQFVYSILENGTYHRTLAPHIDGWVLMDIVMDQSVDISRSPQEYFVQLCERALKFLASAVNAQQLEKREKLEHNNVSLSTMSKGAWQYCVDIIHSLQRLLDGPTFLAVLQNLLSHDQPAVRQKALQILASRLEQLGSERDNVESNLYVGLIMRIRESIQAAVDIFDDKKALSHDDKQAGITHVIGQAQSGVLCIDLLSRHVNKDRDSSWLPKLEECLDTQLLLITEITHSTVAASKATGRIVSIDDSAYPELVRLQGSVLLSSVAVCATLGTQILPKLSGLLQSLLVNIKSHTDSLITASEGVSSAAGISGKKKKLKHNETSASSSLTNNRSRVLLLRCAVSALAALATALPNFMHPYIEDSILLSFAICQINFGVSGLSLDGPAEESGKMLEKDIHKSMVVMISSIPPRLCIPKLVTTSKRLNIMIKESSRTEKASLLIVLIRFVELLSEYWGVLDRQAIASNISQLGPLMLDAMGFRYAIEIQSDISRSLDDKVAEGCVQLCLKLTEAEVRAFFVHASEWMATKGGESDSEDENSSSEADISWLQSAKAVSFFHCVAALNEKMRGVFTASMGCIWGVTANQLADVVSALHSGRLKMSKAPLEEEKVSKKRKKIMGEIEQEESLKSIQEYVLLGTDILNSVRSCCLYDKSGFIDEERYDLVATNAVALLGSRKWFSSDEIYESFCIDTVVPAFTALAIAVGRDTLWKPMNHAILMLTRDKKRIVRVVCVKALHRLFSDVGEEYLILLPESLPFLSELLEDSHPAVAAATSALVRYIEDVSGENMDSYLQ